MQRTQPLRWNRERNRWYLCVPVAVSAPMLQRMVDWAVPRLVDKWRGLPSGDKKLDLEMAIKRLRDDLAIDQHVVGTRGDGNGDIVLFQGKSDLQEPAHLYSFLSQGGGVG